MANGEVIAIIIAAIFVAVIVVGALLEAYIFAPIGNSQITPVVQHYAYANDCDSSRFIQEFGEHKKGGQITYNSNSYFMVRFNDGWPAIVGTGNDGLCYFVDDNQQGIDLFRAVYFSDAISSIEALGQNFINGLFLGVRLRNCARLRA